MIFNSNDLEVAPPHTRGVSRFISCEDYLVEIEELAMKISPNVRNFIQWLGGGAVVLGGVIYVISQFSNLNFGQTYLEKTVKEKTESLEKVITEKTAPISKIDKNLDRIGQKLNDEIIPALNESIGKDRIKTIDLLSQLIKRQNELQLSLVTLLENNNHIYTQISRLDSLRYTMQFFSVRIDEMSQRSEELGSAVRKIQIAQGIKDTTRVLPPSFYLSSNYPNPFNPTTRISYSLPDSRNVQLQIYNITGQLVKTLVNEHQESGKYTVNFDGRKLPSGVYYALFTAGEFTKTQRMVLAK